MNYKRDQPIDGLVSKSPVSEELELKYSFQILTIFRSSNSI